MIGEDLFCGLSYINEKYIDEAEFLSPVPSKKRKGFVFLLAAVISLLVIVAVAATVPSASTAWFFSFFGYDTKTEAVSALTENQNDILDASLTEINQSVSHNGYTITLESGLCDGYRALIKCRVDAPAGVSLNGVNYALTYESNIEFPGGAPGNYSGASYTGYPLEDEDPNDNSIMQLLDIIVQPSEGSSFSLANGSKWGFSFSSIMELSGSGEDLAWNPLCEGVWNFEVTFENELLATETTELLKKPVKCLWSLHIGNHAIPLKAKVFSFELRSLTVSIRYKRPAIAIFRGVYLDKPIYLVMKDGSKLLVKVKMTTYRDTFDETLCLFDRPVSADDIAYIEFPGVGQVAVVNETDVQSAS